MEDIERMAINKRQQTKKDIILALIPTTSHTSLLPSSKSQLLDTVDMFMTYIYADPVETPAKVKTKKSKKETTEKSPSIK